MEGQFKQIMMEEVMSYAPLNGGEKKGGHLLRNWVTQNFRENTVPGGLIYDLQQYFLQLIAKL